MNFSFFISSLDIFLFFIQRKRQDMSTVCEMYFSSSGLIRIWRGSEKFYTIPLGNTNFYYCHLYLLEVKSSVFLVKILFGKIIVIAQNTAVIRCRNDNETIFAQRSFSTPHVILLMIFTKHLVPYILY
jgi:hypothetical protein